MHYATSQSIGNTPLLQLGENLYAKAEYTNLTGSIKDRAAESMLNEAEIQGKLRPGSTVIEPTSGNTGISLAALCRARGYRCIIVMPDSMSIERQQLITGYGAEVVLTPGNLGIAGSVEKAAALSESIPGSLIMGQFENPANPLAHYRTTGPEIWEQTGGKVEIFVAGIGTGGTISGIARYLKERCPHILVYGVEPAASPLLSSGAAGSHGIQGIGANFIPDCLDRSLLDGVIAVSDEDAMITARGLKHVGISAGANVFAAKQLAAQYPQKTVVTVLPDAADRYASLGL